MPRTTPPESASVDAKAGAPTRIGRVGGAVLILFGLLYAYDLWEAIQTLVVGPATFTSVGAPVPWTAFIAGAVVPVAVFAVAIALGRRRRLAEKSVLLFAGLCLVAVLTLTLTAYVRAGGL